MSLTPTYVDATIRINHLFCGDHTRLRREIQGIVDLTYSLKRPFWQTHLGRSFRVVVKHALVSRQAAEARDPPGQGYLESFPSQAMVLAARILSKRDWYHKNVLSLFIGTPREGDLLMHIPPLLLLEQSRPAISSAMSDQNPAISEDPRASPSPESINLKLETPGPNTLSPTTEPYADLHAALVAARDALSRNVHIHANLTIYLIESPASNFNDVTSAAKNNNDALKHIAAAIALLPDP